MAAPITWATPSPTATDDIVHGGFWPSRAMPTKSQRRVAKIFHKNNQLFVF